ncbi:MarR family winged helix-turn-helix transcriptional regulator [Paenibacillus sp. GCM10023248]|uniref:MarR family winged helix-turn-helix transcriptional regulator n=1 Tax=Bacillales TaxID=1385 RepID=UPI00237910E7|nr:MULTISPECIES: MarR family transcriptional regulator [Bacillales]MDD9266374.1 MarR family transcriptional regulator [Paenibacillus sp. MAHUQ-63]MDR6878499.1 DNA-binding MarR family transcriptional regulator [Bacillus sp. 3255]
MHQQSIETIEEELAIFIRRVTSFSSHRKLGNLDRAAYLLMHRISKEVPTGVKILAEQLQLDISTVSRQAAALEQKGYVSKLPDPQDGRSYSLQLTELGLTEMAEYKRVRSNKLKELLQDWSDEDAENFAQLLHKFNRSICPK